MTVSGTILVTGFVPFSEHEKNISQQIIEQISLNPDYDEIIETCVLSVDEQGSRYTSLRIRNEPEVRAVLHLGLSANSEEIRIERFARNRIMMTTPDNSGRHMEEGLIVEGGAEIIETNFPSYLIDHILTQSDRIRLSDDAGGYVCNETYYRSLCAALENHTPKVLFLHLPDEDAIPLIQQTDFVISVCKALETEVDL